MNQQGVLAAQTEQQADGVQGTGEGCLTLLGRASWASRTTDYIL